MTKGGAKRMIFPCVGFAKRPFSLNAIQIFHAVSLSSESLITIALSNPLPRTNVAVELVFIYSPITFRNNRPNFRAF
jgi:hypothetical protein